jgi:hypothetical protein
MQLRKLALLASLATAGAFAACTLNPQPLPPSDLDNQATFGDASTRSDGSFTGDPETPPAEDAGAIPANVEGGVDGGGDGDGGDAGDGGDGGDAGPDADAG